MIAAALIAVLLCLTGVGWHSSADIVTASAQAVTFRAGKTGNALVWVDVRDGYHIQANRVTDDSLVPTTVEVDGGGLIEVRRVRYPQWEKFRLEGTDSFLRVYGGKFAVKMSVRVTADAVPGLHMVRGRLRYQACDSRSCLFPRVAEFEIPLEVREGR